ncbi:hypothetical protein ACH3XW_7775 [Acanthocheilonema viteae]
MSAVETESKYFRDVNNMLPKWFKHTRSIKCGRKIICVDQLYGWRGKDTGYYGSEELEDTPDFLDEVKIPPVQSEVKNEQLEILRKEAKERLKKARETHPNFNVLTDRAPTPDFSVTYIETSYSADDDSVSRSQQTDVLTAIDETEKTAIDDTASDENDINDFGEPMEVDGSSYFHHNTYCQSQNVQETLNQTLLKNNDTNLTYTVEKNEDNKLLLTSNDRVGNSEECEPMLEPKSNETITVEKSQEAEGIMMNPIQEDQKEQHNISVLDSNETAKKISRREILNKAMEVAEHQILQTAGLISIHHENEISPQQANQKIFEYPAPLQATFDLSRIDKFDLSAGGKSEISPINPRASRISRSDLMEQMGNSITRVNTSRPNDRTAISFKTPKQHMRTVVEHTVIRKQPTIATPLFRKRSVASTASRGTSTPIEGSACYVCPRYDAHHAALASHATQTGSGTPISFHSRILPQNALTPIRRPLPCSSRISCELSAGKASTLSRIPVPTSALKAISQYGTPSPSSKRSALVDYELTPKLHVLNAKQTSWQECNKTELGHRHTSCMSSVTQIPLSRFAFEHLKSGGTPRPISSTEKRWKEITGDNSLLSVPKTPVAKTDISQMLVDNVMRSGPAYRRRPHPSKLLSSIGKLRFEKSAENSNLSPKYVSPTAKVSKEEINDTQLVVIESFDGDTMEKLVENTAKLIVKDKEQNIPLEEPEIVFDTTVNEYRKREKTPLFDTGNYFGRRRILSMLNESNVSVNTPGKEEDPVIKINPSFSDNSHNPSDISASPVHIIAAKNEDKHSAVLRARKIVHCEETEGGLRRSKRNRIAPIRHWLGEKPVYRRDQQGTYELVRVEEAVVKDPLFVKYNTIDMDTALERQKREQKQHARARKLRKFDRACRDYAD